MKIRKPQPQRVVSDAGTVWEQQSDGSWRNLRHLGDAAPRPDTTIQRWLAKGLVKRI